MITDEIAKLAKQILDTKDTTLAEELATRILIEYNKTDYEKFKSFGIYPSVMCTASGSSSPDQKIVNTKYGKLFRSYNTNICFKTYDKVYLSENWEYSRTTMKYLNRFLNGTSAKEIRANILSGKYILVKDL